MSLVAETHSIVILTESCRSRHTTKNNNCFALKIKSNSAASEKFKGQINIERKIGSKASKRFYKNINPYFL